MTGFARTAKGDSPRGLRGLSPKRNRGWGVEIRSLNHRYFEFSLKLPSSLYGLEDRIREFCQNRIRRGKVTVNINEANGNSSLEEVALDEKVLQFYLSAFRRVQRRFHLKGELALSDLLSLPRIFSVEKKADAPEKLWPALRPQLEKAVGLLLQSREREGRTLSKDLLSRIRKIEKSVLLIEARARKLPREHFERLRERIQELFKNMASDERLWQEAVLLVERADFTEEMVRLKSHLGLFKEKMARGGEAGKELDFILQEMNREVNTLGAKGQDAGISQEVVGIKAELEKIREQIQNIE